MSGYGAFTQDYRLGYAIPASEEGNQAKMVAYLSQIMMSNERVANSMERLAAQ